MEIKLLVEGGEMKPGPALSQQLGPAGINIGQVISKINEATKNFKGLKVPVILNVNTKTKQFDIQISSPPVSGLIKKQLGISIGSGEQKKLYAGNASIEDIIFVASTKLPNMLCKTLKSAVKTVAGTCVSLGVLIENKSAVEIVNEIAEGKFDKEIKEEKIETSPEKRKQLNAYFNELRSAQEKQKKAEEAAAEAEKAAAAAAATTTASATPGAPTAATATTTTKVATPAATTAPAKK